MLWVLPLVLFLFTLGLGFALMQWPARASHDQRPAKEVPPDLGAPGN